ncbi:Uncharacterised protein [BD1-7 clade bacterium]|uniref:Uncharacterized protein n=1 Tax=BD1-7 clade bacterium TaxID=2029982 RepID=A0A5S9PCL2_9GAMM|nr:Uncharacterised protein [BD1-7 clade bacterium]CAA0101625.1 Uncharacterised protein [BD1-7 clade bacterium]
MKKQLFLSILLFFMVGSSQSAFPSSIFTNTNVVPLNDGSKATLRGVTSINNAGRSAGVVIDARDRFGNRVRVAKTVGISPAKLKSYYRVCLRNPLACVASAAISAALIQYGYSILDGMAVSSANASYPDCQSLPLPRDTDGGVTTALGPIDCQTGPNWRGEYYVYSLSQLSGGQLISEDFSWIYQSGDSSASYLVTRTYIFSSEPAPEPEEIADETLADIMLNDPSTLQIQEGVFPDIFGETTLSDTDQATGEDLVQSPSDPVDLTGVESRLDQLIENTTFEFSPLPSHTINDKTSLDEVMSSFYTRITQAPIIQSFSAVGGVISEGGSCPIFTVDLSGTLIGKTVSTDAHCDLVEYIRPVLGTLMMVVYLIAAFRIFASA